MNSDWTNIKLEGEIHSFIEYEETKMGDKICLKHEDECEENCPSRCYVGGESFSVIKFIMNNENCYIYIDTLKKCCETISCTIDDELKNDLIVKKMHIECGDGNYLQKYRNHYKVGYNEHEHVGVLYFIFDDKYKIKIVNYNGNYYPHMIKFMKEDIVLLKTFI